MLTLRQLEALHWIVELGTFERAANKLHTTQSAISKRIQELEASTGLVLLDRSQRGAKLTEHGEQIVALGRSMLALQDRILMVREGKAEPARRVRIGVTELSALTWLPRFVARLRQEFPTMLVDPDVDLTRNLYERLIENELDLVVTPEIFAFPDISVVRLGEVRNIWMARPGLVMSSRPLALEELAEYPILAQGRRSGTGSYYDQFFKSRGIIFPKTLPCDNLNAQLAFAVAGLGIGYFPSTCFRSLMDEGKLAAVMSDPKLPPVPYAAIFRTDRISASLSAIAELAREACDFTLQWQS